MGNNSIVQHMVCSDGDLPTLLVEIGGDEGDPSTGAQICFQINERSGGRWADGDHQVVFTFRSLSMFQSRNFADVAVDQMLGWPSCTMMMGYSPYRRQISEALFTNAWRVHRPYTLERVRVAFSTEDGTVRMSAARRTRGIRTPVVDDGANRGASRDYVERLERVRFEEEGPSFSAGRFGVERCAVCQDDYVDGTEVVRLPCLHVFHDKCLQRWLEQSNACPLCRYEMPMET